jgi:hypothetical protein
VKRYAALAAVTVALAGCASRLAVTPAGSGLTLAPRSADCKVQFYRTKPPDRAYDEVATLHFTGTSFASAADAQEMMRKRACELGADAVVVTRDFLQGTQHSPGLMTGTAVSYAEAREQHRLDAALRKAEAAQVEEQRKAVAAQATAAGATAKAGAAAPAKGPPAGYVPGRAKETVWTRALADRRGAELDEVRSGADVWMAPQPSSGWRRVWVPGTARSGWVEASAVEPTPAAAPAAEPPRPASDI